MNGIQRYRMEWGQNTTEHGAIGVIDTVQGSLKEADGERDRRWKGEEQETTPEAYWKLLARRPKVPGLFL